MATFLAAALAGPALAISVHSARNGIAAALAKRVYALQAKNLNAYVDTFAPDWMTINVIGRTVTYATLRESMERNFANAQGQSAGTIRSHIIWISLNGLVP